MKKSASRYKSESSTMTARPRAAPQSGGTDDPGNAPTADAGAPSKGVAKTRSCKLSSSVSNAAGGDGGGGDGGSTAWEVFCDGPLLRAVQSARLFPDSKTFVDMPMKQASLLLGSGLGIRVKARLGL